MKFIVSMGIRKLPGSPQPMHEIYRDFLEEAVLAEELGFNAVWASEHHFSPDAWSPSPVPFLAAVTARTRRICIGTYVLLLPLHNPVRIAEDFAVLDNISGGRVDLPVGVGSATEEFHTFGVPFRERLGRMFEGLTVIERCFTGEKFSHQGKYYDFPDVHMTTPTVQQPGRQSGSRRWASRALGAGRGGAITLPPAPAADTYFTSSSCASTGTTRQPG